MSTPSSNRILLGHVTGNINSRQAARAFHEQDLLHEFHTSIAWRNQWKRFEATLPPRLLNTLYKRSFSEVPDRLLKCHPTFELLRHLIPKRFQRLRPSVKKINRHFDVEMAKAVTKLPGGSSVYGYFDTSLETFRAARDKGIRTIYELPTTYWRKIREIVSQHPTQFPQWESSHLELHEHSDIARRRDQELQLADLVIVPSSFVQDSLKLAPMLGARVEVVPYGCPESSTIIRKHSSHPLPPLKVFFAGNLSADKGLPDLLEAVSDITPQVDLTVAGAFASQSPASLHEELSKHRFLGKLSHDEVLEEMSKHEVLVLPSYYEGLALVILEAMSAGLTVITTLNSGAESFIQDGRQGFIVPTGSPQAISSSLSKLFSNRDLLFELRSGAYAASQRWTWYSYRERLVQAIT